MSEQWFSASEEVDSGSDSDQEERRDWVQERARSHLFTGTKPLFRHTEITNRKPTH
jgi:hypothetical protein